jgi:nucleotide-binding universal stress UspA family protein
LAAAASGVPVASANRDGDISMAICNHAAETGTHLIVMTAHARGPLGRFWLGSVADELLRATPAPLLLVHPQERAAEWKEDRTLRDILVPLDGSPLAEQILPTAANLAQVMSANLTLLRVVRPVTPMTLPVGPHSMGDVAHQMTHRIDELHHQFQKEAQDYLNAVRARLAAGGLSAATQVAVEEQPGPAILHRAQAPIDMIALETHGRRGLARLLLGSVADKVIRGSHVPVLVQRPVHHSN